MELYTQLKGLADKVEQLKDKINTEESTKHAFTGCTTNFRLSYFFA